MTVEVIVAAALLPWLATPLDPAAVQRSVHPPVTPVQVVAAYRPPPEPWDRGHRGIDLAARDGQRITAPVDGRVAFAGDVAGRPVITLAIASGLRLTFEPVRTDLSAGDRVHAGSPLGRLAPTGLDASHCGGPDPCLHVGLRSGDRYRDPRPFILGLPVLKPLVSSPGPQPRQPVRTPGPR